MAQKVNCLGFNVNISVLVGLATHVFSEGAFLFPDSGIGVVL